MPTVPGRSCLAPLIGKRGGIAGDFTVTCLGDGDYFMVGSGMAERYHKRFFDAVPLPAGTRWHSVTEAMAGFNVAGPLARDLLRAADECRPVERGVSLHAVATDRGCGGGLHRPARQLYRRSGLGAALHRSRPSPAL
jgi:glycine cleavage system aminomethyltransferase T